MVGCKITVVDKMYNPKLDALYQINMGGVCPHLPIGKQWILQHCNKPGDMCEEGWDCLYRFVWAILSGTGMRLVDGGWLPDSDGVLASCSAGVCPVFFLLERVDLPEEA